jgi:hypothetical protein
MYGYSTPGVFWNTFEKSNVEDGFLTRYPIFTPDHLGDLPKKHVATEQPLDVIKRTYEICDIPFEWERDEEGYRPGRPAGGRRTWTEPKEPEMERSGSLMAISRMSDNNGGEYLVHPDLPDCKKARGLGKLGPHWTVDRKKQLGPSFNALGEVPLRKNGLNRVAGT